LKSPSLPSLTHLSSYKQSTPFKHQFISPKWLVELLVVPALTANALLVPANAENKHLTPNFPMFYMI